jgi:hypothetical protein
MTIQVYRYFYQSSLAALAATGKTSLVYDVAENATLAVWGSTLLARQLVGVQFQTILVY